MLPNNQRVQCPICGRRVNPMNHDCEELSWLEEMGPPEPTGSDPAEVSEPAKAAGEDSPPLEEKR